MPTRSEAARSRNQLTAENFWHRIDVRGDDECWEWQKARTRRGYGTLGPGKNNRFGIELAHRLAFYLTHGQLDPDLFVLHSCDNPPCCNPKHLRQGDGKDNARDMVERGRWGGPSGAGHHLAVLDPLMATDIRWLRASGATLDAIADAFGIGRTTVSRVVKGESWC